MNNRIIKFRYTYEGPGKSRFQKSFRLDQIERGDPYAEISDNPLLKSYRIVARDEFTGLLDRDGAEIYEGDLIKVVYGIPPTSSTLEVVWRTGINKECDEKCQYGINNSITGWWYKDRSNGHDCPMFVDGDVFEIIGNVRQEVKNEQTQTSGQGRRQSSRNS